MAVEIEVLGFMEELQRKRELVYAAELNRERSRLFNLALEDKKQKISTSAFIADTTQRAIDYVSDADNLKATAKKTAISLFFSATLFWYFAVKHNSSEAVIISQNENPEHITNINIIKIPVKSDNAAAKGLEQKVENQSSKAEVNDAGKSNAFFELKLVNPFDRLTKKQATLYDRVINYADVMIFVSSVTGRDPLLYASLIGAESDFNSNATSPAGAYGLGQMTDIAFEELNRQMKVISGQVKFYNSIANLDEKQEKRFEELKEKQQTFKILLGDSADKEKYMKNKAYQIQVSTAYFDFLADDFRKYADVYGEKFNPIEAAACAYNAGPTSTKKLIEEHGADWKNYKLAESNIHWKRMVDYGRDLEKLQSKIDKIAHSLIAMRQTAERAN